MRPDLCFCIISGYQDFEYARDAFRGGVLDYLTKPIVPSQMLRTMKNVEEKLRKFYYDRRVGIFRKICVGESISLEEIQAFFPYKETDSREGIPRPGSRSCTAPLTKPTWSLGGTTWKSCF